MKHWFASMCILGLIGPASASTPSKTLASKPSTPKARVMPPHLEVPKDMQITIEDYDLRTNTFMVKVNDEPGIGPNFADPESLRRAVAFEGDERAFMKQRNQLIGSIMQLKQPLPLVYEDEMDRRNKKAR